MIALIAGLVSRIARMILARLVQKIMAKILKDMYENSSSVYA
jgi:hypothetical protein